MTYLRTRRSITLPVLATGALAPPVKGLARKMTSKRATIQALAEVAGVSENTVKRMRNGARVRHAIREAVVEALATYKFVKLSNGTIGRKIQC